MSILSLVLGLIFLLLAITVGVTAALSARSRLPGNGFIGIRTEETRKSQRTWDAAHRAAAPLWFAATAGFAAAAALAVVSSGWMWIFTAVMAVAALLGVGAGAAAGAATAAQVDAIIGLEQPTEGCCSAGGETSGCSCDDSPAEGTCASGTCAPAPQAGNCATPGAHPADPSVDCGVAGGCGSCELQGSCQQEP